jgi:hypothetical protein
VTVVEEKNDFPGTREFDTSASSGGVKPEFHISAPSARALACTEAPISYLARAGVKEAL